MSAFANAKHFDARGYLANRPQYSQEFVALIQQWHRMGLDQWSSALDIGCGPGQMTYQLIQFFKSVTAVDPSPLMLAAAQESTVPNFLNLPVPEGHQLNFLQAKGESTNLPDESFDLINASTAAHWLPWSESGRTGESIWKEMARLLKPGGTLIFGGYYSQIIKGHQHISNKMEQYIRSEEGWAKYFEFEDPLSSTAIGSSQYRTMPKPLGPYFDEGQTVLLINLAKDLPKISTAPDESDYTMQATVPIPSWIQEVGVKDEDIPLCFNKKSSLRKTAYFLRSVSAWPRYVDEHPEEKALEAQEKDLPFRLLDQWRREEAEETGKKMLEWDDEFQVSSL